MEKIATVPSVAATTTTTATINNKNNNNGLVVVNSPTPINLHGTMLACSGGVAAPIVGDTETNIIGISCTSASDNVSSTHNNYTVVVAAGADNTATVEVAELVGVAPQLKSENNSVNAQTSQRSNFKKSNTCGSLFAKCACGNHYYANFYNPYNTIATTTPTSPQSITEFAFRDQIGTSSSASDVSEASTRRIAEVLSSSGNGSGRKVRRLLQSYSHPDATNLVFTDENKLPKCNNLASVASNFGGKNSSSSSTASVTRSSSRDSYICTKTGKRKQCT